MQTPHRKTGTLKKMCTPYLTPAEYERKKKCHHTTSRGRGISNCSAKKNLYIIQMPRRKPEHRNTMCALPSSFLKVKKVKKRSRYVIRGGISYDFVEKN